MYKAKGSKVAFRRIAGATTTADGYVDTRVKMNRSGFVRLQWTSPGGRVLSSRSAGFHVKKKKAAKKKKR